MLLDIQWAHLMVSDPENTARSASPKEPLIRPFMPELDTLRGVAVLGGLLRHAFYWQYAGLSFRPWARRFMSATQPGWMGVNLFLRHPRVSNHRHCTGLEEQT